MEPFSLAVLAIAFVKSVVTSAGSEIGKAAGARIAEAVFPRVSGTAGEAAVVAVTQGTSGPAEEQAAQQALASEFQRDPALGAQVQSTINQSLQEDPSLADLLPNAVQELFGLSDAQRQAQKGRCPVGGELLWLPQYFDGSGQALSRVPLGSFFSYPRSAWGQCRRGHRWVVFAAGGKRAGSGGLLSRLLGR